MAAVFLNWPRIRLLLPFVVFFALVLVLYRDRHTVQDTLSYSTRPLWDRPDGPTVLLPHLHAEGLAPDDPAACSRHGWKPRESVAGGRKMIDAVLFSTELDLFEVRLQELWNVVDTFVVVESTHTLMGQPKNLTYRDNAARFQPYASKIAYFTYEGRPMTKQDGPFTLVNEMRAFVGETIRTKLQPDPSTLLLMADVDEIPSQASLALIKACSAPLPLHLQLRNYVYSFEFPTDMRSWRAQVHEWGSTGSVYKHGISSSNALADAGWHCSFCFRELWEFAFKMKAASHADRLFNRADWKSYISPKRIQDKICKGEDLFDMLPEAYTWGELIQLWHGAQRTTSAVNLPKAVVSMHERFSFLLPGHCVREG